MGLLGMIRARFGIRAARAEDLIPAGFREEVLSILAARFPGEPFEEDPENGAALKLGTNRLYLGNLYQIVKDQPSPRRHDDIVRWFDGILTIIAKNKHDRGATKSWAEVKHQVRPLLVPRI